jgi:ribosome-binding factor A
MSSQSGRPQRVGELIRKEVAELLMRRIKDPRLGFVSVMGVEMSPDLRYATIYVSLYGNESERKASLVALQRSTGWVRRELGKTLRLRYTPLVRFAEDNSLDRVFKLEETLRQLKDSEEQADGEE